MTKWKSVQYPKPMIKEDPLFPTGFTLVNGHPSLQLVNVGSRPSSYTFASTAPISRFQPMGNAQALPIIILEERGISKETIKEQTLSLEVNCKYEVLEERLRAVEGTNVFGSVDAFDLCFVPNVILPPMFEVLDFEKFSRSKCLVIHLKMYCQKIVAYSDNDKLLIHCFEDSLTGAAMRWYIQLDRTKIRTWKDLAHASINQYMYVIEMAPDRLTLKNKEKKKSESFKELCLSRERNSNTGSSFD
ncbi:uncharacterized protein LOC131162567 [Malania oleifera]|uniref:uncharacterized protein LOC131162567 n=1 Tax=Malania oleifera TaxID=397392 RepID=UPI0025ADA703|nr:uncharacterized protein LOC131162567 [Malania oleifera]